MEQIGADQAVATARDLLERAGDRRVLLGLTGAPGAGKSTLTAALRTGLADLVGSGVAVVPMDGFHLAQAELERLGRADRKGAPDTFDAAGFVALLRRLRAADEPVVYAPEFRREIEEPIACALPVPAQVRLVLVEGNYLLLEDPAWAPVRTLLDECWYLQPDDALRVQRLVARHVAHGRSPEAAREWVLRSDEANARVVAASRHRADRVVLL